MKKLIGVASEGATDANITNRFYASKFTAVQSGKMLEFRIHMHGSGNVKVAIYADNAGEIGTQLWVQNTGQAVLAEQWNRIKVSPHLSIVSGTLYWLAVNYSADNIGHYAYTDDALRYGAYDYATIGCPASPTGLSSETVAMSLQGWGGLPPQIIIF